MAYTKQKRPSSPPQFKAVLLGAIATVSSVIAIVLSQPHFAVASMNGESCPITEMPAIGSLDQSAMYSRAAYADARLNNSGDPLFWNQLTMGWMTDEQIHLMRTAYRVGFEDGGREHAELLQAILLQETIAGYLGRIGHMTAPVGKRSYGVMQVKITAARDMLRDFPEFGKFHSDEELIVALMMDDEFNIRVASRFLLHLQNNTRTTDAALVAYNIGLRASRKIARPEEFKYVVRTRRNLTEVVQAFNTQMIDPVAHLAMR